MYPFIEIFGKTIGTYGIATAAGMLVAALVFYFLLREKELAFEDVVMLSLIHI